MEKERVEIQVSALPKPMLGSPRRKRERKKFRISKNLFLAVFRTALFPLFAYPLCEKPRVYPSHA